MTNVIVVVGNAIDEHSHIAGIFHENLLDDALRLRDKLNKEDDYYSYAIERFPMDRLVLDYNQDRWNSATNDWWEKSK